MAIKSSKHPVVFTGSNSNPNTAKLSPTKVGDLYIDTDLKTIYFAFGMSGTQWGTAGTA